MVTQMPHGWAWGPLYDRLSSCGRPLDLRNATALKEGISHRGKCQHRGASVGCTNRGPMQCTATIEWPAWHCRRGLIYPGLEPRDSVRGRRSSALAFPGQLGLVALGRLRLCFTERSAQMRKCT